MPEKCSPSKRIQGLFNEEQMHQEMFLLLKDHLLSVMCLGEGHSVWHGSIRFASFHFFDQFSASWSPAQRPVLGDGRV